MYFSAVYGWAAGTSTTAITRISNASFVSSPLRVKYTAGVGHLYTGAGRIALPYSGAPAAAAEVFLAGWHTPAGYAATDYAHYIASSRFKAIVITVPDPSKIGGGISWALTTSLSEPRQICGVVGSNILVIDGGTKIKKINNVTGAATDHITGLTNVYTCALDAGGSGDILLVDGLTIKRAPASSSFPITASGLSTVFTLSGTTLTPIVSIAGDVSKSIYFVTEPADYDNDQWATLTNANIIRIKSGVATTVGGPNLDSGGVWVTDTRYGNSLAMNALGELFIMSAATGNNLAYVNATEVNAASDFSTKWLPVGDGQSGGSMVSIVSDSQNIYTAGSGVVYKAC
jgi:hypothetical protein